MLHFAFDFLLASDVNLKEIQPNLSEFLSHYHSKNLKKIRTCFKNRIDLFITNSIYSF